jgi:hypothetical protein
VGEGITCVTCVLRESPNRICKTSIRLRIIEDFEATLLQEFLALKDAGEMEVDRGVLYQSKIS